MATKDQIEGFIYDSGDWGICTNLYPEKDRLPVFEGILDEIGQYLPNPEKQDAAKPASPDEEYRFFIKLVSEYDENDDQWYGRLKVNNHWRNQSAIESLVFDYNEEIDFLYAIRPKEGDRLISGLPNWNFRHYLIYKVSKGNTSRSVIVWERDPESGGDPIQVLTMYPWCMYSNTEDQLPDDIA